MEDSTSPDVNPVESGLGKRKNNKIFNLLSEEISELFTPENRLFGEIKNDIFCY